MDDIQVWTITCPSDELRAKMRKLGFRFARVTFDAHREYYDSIQVYLPKGWTIKYGSRMNSIFDEKGDIRYIDFLGEEGYHAKFCEVRPAREVHEELDKLHDHIVTSGLDVRLFWYMWPTMWNFFLPTPEMVLQFMEEVRYRQQQIEAALPRRVPDPAKIGPTDFQVRRIV